MITFLIIIKIVALLLALIKLPRMLRGIFTNSISISAGETIAFSVGLLIFLILQFHLYLF